MRTLFLLAATLLVLFFWSMRSVSAQDQVQNPAGDRSAPPLVDFTKSVSPTTASGGEVVRYVLTFSNPLAAEYTGTVVFSDTLDLRLGVNLASRTAQRSDGTAVGVFDYLPPGSQGVGWRGVIVPGDAVTITFDVTLTTGVTVAEVLTNVAALYALGAATETLTAAVPLLLQPFLLELPIVARGLEPLPRLVNGDFELGPALGWLSLPPDVIVPYTKLPGIPPPAGSAPNQYLAWFGGADNAAHRLIQTVVLPRGYVSASLRYQYWIASQESACDQDVASLTVVSHGWIAPLVTPIELCFSRNTLLPGQGNGWRTAEQELDSILGQIPNPTDSIPLTITLEAVLNGSLNSNLWIENVELCSDQVGALDAPLCTAAKVVERAEGR
jgi:uncharacterized repeat protein (TIGR01451 family)